MDSSHESSLITSCQAGNLHDFGPLYDHYVTPIFRFISYRTLDRSLAEDLTSQAFLKALEKIQSFDAARGTFSAWLYGIARNAVADHFRSKRDSMEIADGWDMASDDDLPTELKNADQRAEIRKALQSLTPAQREIVLLRVWDDLSYRQISAIVGKSEDNCKMIFSRSIASLRASFPAGLALLLLFPSSL